LEKAKPGVKPTELRPKDGHNSKTTSLANVGVSHQRANETENQKSATRTFETGKIRTSDTTKTDTLSSVGGFTDFSLAKRRVLYYIFIWRGLFPVRQAAAVVF
jgi:hypothetical protein